MRPTPRRVSLQTATVDLGQSVVENVSNFTGRASEAEHVTDDEVDWHAQLERVSAPGVGRVTQIGGLTREWPAAWHGQSLQVVTASHILQLLFPVSCCIRNLSVSSKRTTTTLEEWTGTASSLLSALEALAPSM